MTKKVCILTSVHPALDTRIFFREASTLAEAGYDVALIARHKKDETINGIKIIHLNGSKNRFFRFLSSFTTVLPKAMRQKAGIYHFHDPELIPACLLLKALTGAKIIYDIHENIPKQILSKPWIPKPLRSIISFLVNLIQRSSMPVFDRIIYAWEEPTILTDNRIIVLNNYPRLELYKKCKEDAPKNGAFTALYCGGLTRIRGIREIVEAAGLLRSREGFRLKLIGGFESESFKKEVMSLPGWEKVDYIGHIPYSKTPEHCMSADAGLICLWPEPNHFISCPNKLFEYMASGIPVVASDFPSLNAFIKDNLCGICVDPMEPKEIASAVEYLIEHPEEAKQMGLNGRKAVEERYNWNKESKKLLEIYDGLKTE